MTETPGPTRTSRSAGPGSLDGELCHRYRSLSICYGICGSDGQQSGVFLFCFYLAGYSGTEPECASSDTRVSVIKIVSGNSNNALCSQHLP